MLRITADVNGYRIGNLFVHNTGRRHKDNVWEYHAATWDASRQDGVFGIEGVMHKRDDSWLRLLSRVQDKAFDSALAEAQLEDETAENEGDE